ncbi:MAG: hypothetical protein ACRDSS_14025, partial [Actinocrinis sp.]
MGKGKRLGETMEWDGAISGGGSAEIAAVSGDADTGDTGETLEITGREPARRPAGPGHSRRALLWTAVGAALVSTGGLAASTLVKSPAQQAAETGPPAASVLTAAVENRVLKNTVVARGTVEAARQVQVTPSGSTQGSATQVVTAVRTKSGARVEPGAVLLEVSGRPLIALPGAVPA